MAEPERLQMTIQYGAEEMHFACWITQGKNTDTLINI